MAHFSWLLLRDCSFYVRESGRQQVLREKRKGVHAFVHGEFVEGSKDEKIIPSFMSDVSSLLTDNNRVRYNPYLYAHFFEATTLNPIHSCELALLFNKQVFKIPGYSIL